MEGRSDIDVDNGARREGLASASDFARPLVRRRPSRDDLRSQFEALVSNRVLECGWLCAPRQMHNSHCQATGSSFFLFRRALPTFAPWPASFSPSASLRKVVCACPLGCANACDGYSHELCRCMDKRAVREGARGREREVGKPRSKNAGHEN